MYGVQGRTWVALGDPVGPDDRLPGLVRQFLERERTRPLYADTDVDNVASRRLLERCGFRLTEMGHDDGVDYVVLVLA